MPRRDDVHRILIIGSGPIIIGQACEFDYSGTQACKALREEGYGVVLLNSNPATIMTDPEMADRTYIEPITPTTIEKVLIAEAARGTPVDAVLPTLGGQTGLNCAVEAADAGIFERHGVKMLGANRDAIHKAEDRTEFKLAMQRIGLDLPRSGVAHTIDEARVILKEIGLPVVLRPAYTLGGTGGGIAATQAEFDDLIQRGLRASRVSEVLIEESLVGWKEFELEVMRDRVDNVVIICSIENFDPMGVHTGDSITVAPQQTLTDKEYQRMRDSAIAIIREIGVETGGSNIQFAVDPKTGRQVVIEMNPRVSRSSALASKATGYPIAKIAAKLAVGYTLDELPNDITKKTPASFEPVLDYVVVKIPRFAFEKFPEADQTLTTQMKSVGEAMAIGRTFKEALQKCIRSMEIKRFGLGLDSNDKWLAAVADSGSGVPVSGIGSGASRAVPSPDAFRSKPATSEPSPQSSILTTTARDAEPPADWEESHASRWPISERVLEEKLARPSQGRLYYVRYAFKLGWDVERVAGLTYIDPWFLENIQELTEFEDELVAASKLVESTTRPPPSESEAQQALDWLEHLKGNKGYSFRDLFHRAGSFGYSTTQLARVFGLSVNEASQWLTGLKVEPAFRTVDTCAAEFEAYTPYYYSGHDRPYERHEGTKARRHGGKEEPGSGVQSGSGGRGSGDGNRGPQSLVLGDDLNVSDRSKVVILGGGPNRIGQGIEFDYCCVHAVMAAREMGYETVMVNSNPETVSTDYDTADLLFFEPLTLDDVTNICRRMGCHSDEATKRRGDEEVAGQRPVPRERSPQSPALGPGEAREGEAREGEAPAEPARREARPPLAGVIVQFGGQTPLNLAAGLKAAGVPILGTSPEAIHLAEDREEFAKILHELYLKQPANGIAYDMPSAKRIAAELGYPVLVRPSYVLGGRGMQKCNIEADLERYMLKAIDATDRSVIVDRAHPILIDKFLDEAVEVDVDCVADYGCANPTNGAGRCVVCGVMEHIEEAGIHSGDSSCALPPYALPPLIIDELKRQADVLARRMKVCGLMNIQFAVKNNVVYVLEVNPRASRTVPFVSKATGVPWAKVATRVMLGDSLEAAMHHYGFDEAPEPRHVSVKSVVFPFNKFPGVDVVLGPEMRSTGEVMGIDQNFAAAFAKAMEAAGQRLPTTGSVLVSVNDSDKPAIVMIAHQLAEMGFRIYSTLKTREALQANGIEAAFVSKGQEGPGPHLIDLINEGRLDLLINTPIHWGSATGEGRIRAAAVRRGIPIITTITGARAAVTAIRALRKGPLTVRALQDYHTHSGS